MKKSELKEIRNILSENATSMPAGSLKGSGVSFGPNGKGKFVENVRAGNGGITKWAKTLSSDIKKIGTAKDDKALWVKISDDLWTIIAIAQKTQKAASYGPPKK